MPSTHQILATQRKMIVEKLRSREPNLVRELESVEMALQNLGEDAALPGLYTPYQYAIDAVTAYLERVLRTEDEENIAQAIVEGGWLRGKSTALKNARNSIRYHLKNPAQTKTLKRFPSGRVGLYTWTKDFDQV